MRQKEAKTFSRMAALDSAVKCRLMPVSVPAVIARVVSVTCFLQQGHEFLCLQNQA